MSTLSLSIRDRGGEIGRTSFTIAVAGTDTADGLATLETGLRAVVDPLILGVIAKSSVSIEYLENDGVPLSNFAQREIGLRILMTGDSSSDNFSLTIPTPDLDALTILDNSDDVELADAGVMAALVAWIEANVEPSFGADPDTETVTVRRAYVVGRNN